MWKFSNNTIDLFPDEEKHADNKWFDDTDEVFSFKHQTYNRMRENKDDQKLYLASKSRSSRSSKHPSKCGSTSSKSSSKGKAIKEKSRNGRADDRGIIHREEAFQQIPNREAWTWRKGCQVKSKGQEFQSGYLHQVPLTGRSSIMMISLNRLMIIEKMKDSKEGIWTVKIMIRLLET